MAAKTDRQRKLMRVAYAYKKEKIGDEKLYGDDEQIENIKGLANDLTDADFEEFLKEEKIRSYIREALRTHLTK